MHIYRITNKINGKIYIGMDSSDRDKRWHDHLRDYSKKLDEKVLYRAMRKYGKEQFDYAIGTLRRQIFSSRTRAILDQIS